MNCDIRITVKLYTNDDRIKDLENLESDITTYIEGFADSFEDTRIKSVLAFAYEE